MTSSRDKRLKGVSYVDRREIAKRNTMPGRKTMTKMFMYTVAKQDVLCYIVFEFDVPRYKLRDFSSGDCRGQSNNQNHDLAKNGVK